MANAIHFNNLCLWLLLLFIITLSSDARYAENSKYMEVPRTSCEIENLENPSVACPHGFHIVDYDSCESRKICYAGPDDYCRNNDERYQCHPDLRCDPCNKCVGCIGTLCNDPKRPLCPSREMHLKRWRKRFGGLFFDLPRNT